MRRLTILCLFILTITSHAQTDTTPRPVITPENAHQLTQIAQLGRGNILDFAFIEDGNKLRVLSTIGIWDYDMTDLSAPPVWTEMYLPDDSQLSPDNRLVIFNPIGSQMAVYDIAQKRVLNYTDGYRLHVKPFSRIAMNDASDKLFFEAEYVIYEWDFLNDEPRPIIQLSKRLMNMNQIGLSPNGQYLVTVHCLGENCHSPYYNQHELIIWDATTGQRMYRRDVPYIADIEFDADSQTILFSANQLINQSNIIRMSLVTGIVTPIVWSRYDGHLQTMTQLEDKNLLAVAGGASSGRPHLEYTGVSVFDTSLGEPLLWIDLQYDTARIRQLEFHPSGRYLVGVGFNDILHIWDMSNGAEIVNIYDHSLNSAVSIHPKQVQIAIGTEAGYVLVWDMDTASYRRLPVPSEDDYYLAPIDYVGFTPDGRYLLAYNIERDSVTIAYDTATWQIQHDVYAPGLGWASPHVQFHPTEPLVAFSDRHNTTIVWNYETDETVFDGWNPMADMAQHQPVFTPDGDYLIYARQETDGTRLQLVVLDLHTQQFYKEIRHPKTILTVTLSPDGASLLVGLEDGLIWVWDVATWRFRHAIWGYKPFISPDSQNAIAYVPAPVMYVYDLYTGEKISESWSPSKEVIGNPVFSLNSQVMLIATSFGMIHLENMQTGERFVSVGALPLARYEWNALKMPQLAFSSDGTFITVADGGVIRVFGIPTD